MFLTALLATLAMVLGSLVIAAPANAKNDPDKTPPGQSEQGPPGHQGGTTVTPGHTDDGTPGNSGTPTEGTNTPGMSHDKITICHATAAVSNPYTMPKVDMASVDEWGNADLNGHGDHYGPVFTATMVQGDHWGDIIPPFTYQYTVKEGKGQDKVDVTKTITYGGLNWDAGKAIYDNGCALPTTEPKPATLCYLPTRTEVSFLDDTAKEYTDALKPGSLYTTLPCPKGETTPAMLCDLLRVPPAMVTFPDVTALEYQNAFKDAQAATHTQYAMFCPDGIVDAAVAAGIPLPATVAAPAPAKVTVPAKGPTLPAAVPAGDGSTAPNVPLAALAAMVLGATALAMSTMRLVGAKR